MRGADTIHAVSVHSFGRRVRGRLTTMRWPRAVEERFVARPRIPSQSGGNGATERRKYFVVCGADPLAHRLVDELYRRYDANVTVILPSRQHNHGPQIARIPGVRIIESEQLDAEAFRAAKVQSADALALVEQNDVGNIDAALVAQELNPDLRLVLRVFNTSLGYRVRRQLPNCTVLSDAAMASPAFVSAALGEVELNHVRLPGRTLYVTHRREVQPHQVMCGLAVSTAATESLSTDSDKEPEVLPADQERADLVLAVADGAGPASLSWTGNGETGEVPVPMPRRRKRYQWRVPALREALQALVDRKLWLAVASLVAVLLIGTVALAVLKQYKPWDAAYVTLLTAVGGAEAGNDPEHIKGWLKVTEVIITLAGIALVPAVTAAIVEAILKARLAVALGRLRQPVADHVVVIGLGNVGTRVIRGLHEFGVPVVAIDRVNTARGADLARSLDIPLIIGDASQEATLRAASVETCRALVVLSTDDNVNLEAALGGRGLKPDLRIVLRLFNGEFARRVQRAFGIAISHSVSYVAAPAFAAAMMEREVLASIPVGRRVLLIAEVEVCPGSIFDGQTVDLVDVPGQARVIGIQTENQPAPLWTPPVGHPIRPSDRLIVVATRAGLADVVAGTSLPPPT